MSHDNAEEIRDRLDAVYGYVKVVGTPEQRV